MTELPSENWRAALPASDVIGSAEAENAVAMHARVLGRFYAELISNHIPPELAYELVVEMDSRLNEPADADD